MRKKKEVKKPMAVWYQGEKKRCVIDSPKVVDFLNYMEFGIYKDEIIRRDENSVLDIYSKEDISRFLFEYYMDFDEKEYDNPKTLGVVKSKIPITSPDGEYIGEDIQYFSKDEVRKSLMKFGWYQDTLKIYLNQFNDDKLKVKGEDLHTPIFKDNRDTVYTFFDSGVVKTSKTKSELISYDEVEDGYIWKSSIRPQLKKIEIDNSSKGMFEKFVELSMSVKNDKGEWNVDEKEYENFRTVYGYMLSNYNNGGQTNSPVFVDRDTDGKHAEGGNGKSLVMGSVEQWKKTLPINGKNISQQDKFLFSGVQSDTEFIFLDDVGEDFNFKVIYNYTTSDMEIEKKFKDRIVIDKNSKPKIGIATNYILDDTDFSTKRRQYIVEFGSFWHDKLKEEGIEVMDYFNGKRLFDDFDEMEWNNFFNYGFRCVQEYLLKGVVGNPNSSYKRKQIISKIEGKGVNDGVVDWMTNWIEENELNLREGLPINDLFVEFDNSFDIDISDKWDFTRLKKGLFELCDEKKWNFNPHKVGKTYSQKRWLKGPKNEQKEWIKIHLK